MKKRTKRKQKSNFYLCFFIFLLLFFAFFAGFGVSRAINSFEMQPSENPKTEMNVLPIDVQRELDTASPSASFRVPILMYHYVEYVKNKNDKIRQILDVVPSVFTAQVVTLKDAGYTFMTARDLGEVLDGKMPLPEKPVLLTFDDGHRDFFTDVLPVLMKFHVKATSYIISGFLGGSDFMTPEQVKEIEKSGLVDVGAHTVHHVALKGKSETEDKYEVTQSKKDIENLIHAPVVSFAYPYGSFDTQAEKIVKDAGFSTAVSTIAGVDVTQNNRFFIYRLRPGNRTGQELLNFLQQSLY